MGGSRGEELSDGIDGSAGIDGSVTIDGSADIEWVFATHVHVD